MGIFINTQQHNRFIYLSLWMNLCCCFVFIKFISSTWHNTQYVYVSTEFEIKTQFHCPGDEWIKWEGRKTIESWIELIEYEIQALFIDANNFSLKSITVNWATWYCCHSVYLSSTAEGNKFTAWNVESRLNCTVRWPATKASIHSYNSVSRNAEIEWKCENENKSNR